MTAFVLRRVLWTLPVLLIVVTTIFFMMRAIGGDPFRHGPLLGLANTQQGKWTKYGDPQPESISENLHRRYGLDLPWYEQYGNYLAGVAMFDFGPSLSFRNVTVNEILREQAPRSIELGALAFLWAFGLGIPLGVLAALRQGSPLDAGIRFFSSVGFAVPSFLVAVMLVYVLSVKLGVFPTNGWTSWRHKVLPSFTLGLVPLALCTRLVRGATIEALEADYVVAARAKGLRRRRVVAAHALRNALIPVITAGGPMLGYLLTGSFVIELIFSVPGIGRYYIASVSARDYNVVLGITVLLALVIILANLIVDVLHALLDPRVREAST
jgi:oligopeptide transport system permease protein